MKRLFSTESIARAATRRPWMFVAAWLVVFAVAGFFALGINDKLSNDMESTERLDSVKADHLIEDRFGAAPIADVVVVRSNDGTTVDDPAFRSFVDGFVADIRGIGDEIGTVNSYYESGDESLVSGDRDTLMLPVVYASEITEASDAAGEIIAEAEELTETSGYTVAVGGDAAGNHTFSEITERDLAKSEQIGLPITLLVLVIVFGALVAAGVPLGMSAVAIPVAAGITAIIGNYFELSIFVLNVITMIGLAVGVDYSLFIVQRYREERRNGHPRDTAIAIAGGTASRAVLFSGMAVVVSLAAMALVPNSIFQSLAIGSVIVVVVSVLAALTLLPAVLRLLGDRIDRLHIRIPFRRRPATPRTPFWARMAHLIMGHAVISLVAATGLLLALAAPVATLELGSFGASSLPKDTSTYLAYTVLGEEFEAGAMSPTKIVIDADAIDSPEVQGAIDNLEQTLAGDQMFGEPSMQVSPDGTLAVINIPLNGDPNGPEAEDAVLRLRDNYIPAAFNGQDADALVTGTTAGSYDYKGLIADYLPIVIGTVLALSFLILLVVFRSIIVPLKAIVLNLLAVGAAYGLMVLVFRDGVGADLLGVTQVDEIEAWVPLFMFAILFGLSMDYHVFLLSRIREHFDQTGNNREAVAHGLQSSGSIITGAAAIMVVVFGGFATGEIVSMQQVGFGLAASIFIDATIVRSVLVPASMTLLGRWNWYLPSWLGWLPNVDIEGARTEASIPHAYATGGD